MAPKAAAAKAKAKAKAKYRPRGIGTRVAPPALQARNEHRRLALRARTGFLRICPACAYPRYVPSAAHCRYACAMPSVQVANGDWVRCDSGLRHKLGAAGHGHVLRTRVLAKQLCQMSSVPWMPDVKQGP